MSEENVLTSWLSRNTPKQHNNNNNNNNIVNSNYEVNERA